MMMNHTAEDHLTVVRPPGEFTADDVDSFQHLCMQRIANGGRDFIVDLGEVEFLDSAALEALLWLDQRTAELLGQLRLVGAGENVRKILELTRLAPRFQQDADVETARRGLAV